MKFNPIGGLVRMCGVRAPKPFSALELYMRLKSDELDSLMECVRDIRGRHYIDNFAQSIERQVQQALLDGDVRWADRALAALWSNWPHRFTEMVDMRMALGPDATTDRVRVALDSIQRHHYGIFTEFMPATKLPSEILRAKLNDGAEINRIIDFLAEQWPRRMAYEVANLVKLADENNILNSVKLALEFLKKKHPELIEAYERPFSERAETATPLEFRAALDAALKKHPTLVDDLRQKTQHPSSNYGWALGKFGDQDHNVYHRIYNPITGKWDTVRIAYTQSGEVLTKSNGWFSEPSGDSIEGLAAGTRQPITRPFVCESSSVSEWASSGFANNDDWAYVNENGAGRVFCYGAHPATGVKRAVRIKLFPGDLKKCEAVIIKPGEPLVPLEYQAHVMAVGRVAPRAVGGVEHHSMVSWASGSMSPFRRAIYAVPCAENPMSSEWRAIQIRWSNITEPGHVAVCANDWGYQRQHLPFKVCEGIKCFALHPSTVKEALTDTGELLIPSGHKNHVIA